MLQKMVVEPTALFHLPVQERFLFAGRIQPIPECFSHVGYYKISYIKCKVTPYPEGWGLTAFSDKKRA